jgi:cytochrome bd-type quinol oxidase subunit 2
VRAGPAVLLAGGVAYSLGAASTKPFTQPANVLTGLAVVAMAVVVLWRWPLRTRSARSEHSEQTARPEHPYLLWLVLLVAFTAWELVNYGAHGSRAAHPTFSSITEAIDRYYVLKALLFLIWLGFGWVIVRRGTRAAGQPARPEASPQARP